VEDEDVVARGLVGLACALLLALPATALAGAVTGTVRLEGAPPPPTKLPVTIDQYVCGREKEGEDLVLSPQRGIRYAVVSLVDPPAAAAALPTALDALPTPEMDQQACSFAPRVVLVPAGGTVRFLNSDRLLHNLHSAPGASVEFNRTQPKGRTIPIVFPTPGIVRVSCDLHSWMRAWVVVAEHPFYAVTDAEGRFTLRGVPPGRYRLRVWQERLGTVTQDVVVRDGQDAAVVVGMTGK